MTHWHLFEQQFNKALKNYRFIFRILGSIAFILLLFASTHFPYYPLFIEGNPNYYRIIEIISISIMISIVPSGIIDLFFRIQTVNKLNLFIIDNNGLHLILEDFNNRIRLSGVYGFLRIIIITAPFIPMDAYNIYKGASFTPLDWGVTPSNVIFAIFYYLIIYFINLLLVLIVWIVLNISWFLGKLTSDSILSKIKINVFHGFSYGSLSNIYELLKRSTTYYFLCISLAILIVLKPSDKITLPEMFYFIIFLLGITFYSWGQLSIRKIFTGKLQIQIMEINNLYEDAYYRLKSHLSEDSEDVRSLSNISFVLDILQEQRERLMQIDKSWEGLLNLIQIFAPLLLSIITIWYRYN